MKRKLLPIDCTTCQNMAASAFCTLKSAELHDLNRYKTTRYIKKGGSLFFENDAVKGLHCVHEGKIKLYNTLHDGNVQILRIAKGADLIGYRALVGNGHYIASAEALEDSVVCFIPKERIFTLIATNLQFSLELMSKIAADTHAAEIRAVSFLKKSSKERLAEALLLLENSFGVTSEGYINIRLTREEIANFTGMAAETTVRTLHAWENEGLISLFKRSIRILNKPALLELSGATE